MRRSDGRRFAIGAEPRSDGVHFRVWAPRARTVAVELDGRARAVPLSLEPNGYFSGLVEGIGPGARYRFRLDDGEALPDPASRYQPEGPHGPSQVVDPSRFPWTDRAWKGPSLRGQVLYELHVGTFTREGTFRAAIGELDELAALGITTIELMPVADFPGRFGWGYDGVDLWAPCRLYGEPDDLRALVDAAHARGIAVLLDVVYNHLGPSGNYLGRYADAYFTRKYHNEWGDAVAFDEPSSGPVREFFVENARHWIEEYHLDGLRIDATQSMFDRSEPHVLVEIARAVREAAGSRRTLLVGENEPQHARLAWPVERGGMGLDALWNDDFHHTARVAITGRDEAYYVDYRGTPQELVSAFKYGYLFQGQRYLWQGKRRGTPARDLRPEQLVVYLQNHDQVANSAYGTRLHADTSPGRFRAATAILLLSPQTPMLFMGQELGTKTPFLYFADHEPELAKAVREGRARFLSQFPSVATPEIASALPDPADPRTFERCRLDRHERDPHVYALHADLLRLRREDPVFAAQLRPPAIDGAVLGPHAFAVRWFGEEHGDRLLLVNLGRALLLERIAEPLLAPPEGARWTLRWSSESLAYGGHGTPAVEREDGAFALPAESAIVLATRPSDEPNPREDASDG